MRYKITAWAEYQHYKDRCPPWIKLHHSLLTSKTWIMGTDASRTLAIASMLLAARDNANDGSFDGDPEFIKRFAYLNAKPDFKQLIEYGFIELVQDASNVLAECNTETEAYKATEAEKRQRKSALAPDYQPTDDHFLLANELGINLQSEIEVFKDHWKSKGEKRSDWDATLRNWIKRAAQYKQKNAPARTVQEARLSVAQQIMGGSNGTHRPTRDITPGRTIEGSGKSIPETPLRLREPDAS